MYSVLLPFLESFLLVVALSTDAFVASFAYGAGKIQIPPLSVLLLSAVCSVILTLSLLAGSVIRPYLPEWFTRIVCFLLLFTLGLVKLFDSTLKACIRRHKGLRRKIRFSMFHLRFILSIYADPEEADLDASRVLSPSEAASLALALSLDGLAVGFGAGLSQLSAFRVLFLSFAAGCAAVKLGAYLGNLAAKRLTLDLSWLSGALLLLLAFLKL